MGVTCDEIEVFNEQKNGWSNKGKSEINGRHEWHYCVLLRHGETKTGKGMQQEQ
jgi:hypothetical protein